MNTACHQVGYLLLASGQSNMVFSLGDLVGNFSGTPFTAAANQALASIPKNNMLRLHQVGPAAPQHLVLP